jgi:hypothetical protein
MKLVFIFLLSLSLSGCIGIIPLAIYEYNYRNQLEANCQQGHQSSCEELDRKHKADRDYTPVADARH